MAWFDFWLAFAAAAAIMVIPGFALLGQLRLSWGSRLVFAPITSAAIIAVFGVAYAALGVGFSPISFVAGVAALVLAGYLLRRYALGQHLPAEQSSWTRGQWIGLIGGLGVAGIGWLYQFVHQLGSAGAVAKTYDTTCHLAMVRHIVDTGNASTLTAGICDPSVTGVFYPASWHGIVALLVRATPADLPTAVNATILAVMAVAWPLSLVAFTRTILRPSVGVIFTTAALSCAFVACPIRFTVYGPLYANQWGFALLPALLAGGVLAFRRDLSPVARWLLLGTALVGDAVAQPNTIFTAGLLLFPYVLGLLYRWQSERGRRRAILSVVGALAVAGAAWWLIASSPFMHTVENVDWGYSFESAPRAIQDVVRVGGYGPSLPLSALILAGLVVAWFRIRWLVWTYAAAAMLYLIGSANVFGHRLPTFRKYVTGFWFHDPPRLAAILVLVALPLGVLGITCLGDLLSRWAGRRGRSIPTTAVAVVVAVAALGGALVSPAIRTQAHELRVLSPMPPGSDQNSSTINADKVDFMRRARAIAGSAGVANDPNDGSSYAYGLVDLHVFYKSLPGSWGTTRSPDVNIIRRWLDKISTPGLCAALQREHITYALQLAMTGSDVYGHPYPRGLVTHRGRWSGLNITERTPGFELVAQSPSGRLFRITGC